MLQMVNVDLLKSAEGIKDNFVVDDEIKDETVTNYNNNDNTKKKLPRIISQNNIKNNTNIYLNNQNEDKEINSVNENIDNINEGPKLLKIIRKNKVDKL
jgi:hypothetical protein